MSTQTPAVVRDYLARVRTALADLPPAEVDEILEDVRPHLLEIGTELGEEGTLAAMTERLGSPESYAAELRAAGDYPSPEQAGGRKLNSDLGSRLALWSLAAMVVILLPFGVMAAGSLSADALLLLIPAAAVLAAGGWYLARHGDAALGRLPELKPLRTAVGRESKALAYLKSLRPAWWLLCAAVLVVFGLLLFLDEGREGMLALVALAAVAVVIVWFGPKSVADRKWLWLSLPVSALVVGVVLGLVTEGVFRVANSRYNGYGGYGQTYNTVGGQPVLSYGNTQVENIYAFDAEGKPLSEVYLFDQDGKPLTLPRYGCEPGTGSRQREGADNQFPRPEVDQYGYDDQGHYNGYNAYQPGCRVVPGVPFTAAIPKVPAPPAAPGVPTPGVPTPDAPTQPPTAPPTPSAPATAPTPTG
ncbi:DUF1700 domain-containing protein [Amycolatopsis sp. 195334CR]|uniref:DUF1700 domain-containing protein n=1 Tax=Amycolatopsis sp. 195334CR TaxID=2814588 RepID=UPI001A90A9D5|nr:hypothetical protein [Amycolatopsis sp. 195334CR]MBN6033439.1 hypothetical protein [Amycolatopsis sp. 195334CR]